MNHLDQAKTSSGETGLVLVFAGPDREGVVLHLLHEGLPVRAMFVPAKPRPRQRASIRAAVAACQKHHVPVTEVTAQTLAAALEPHAGNVLLNIGGEYFLPRPLRERFHMCLNLHPTLLPRCRGASSIAHVILEGDAYHGSTVHVMEDELDAGPIVMQAKFPVSPYDTYTTLQTKAYALEPELAAHAVAQCLCGQARPVPQNQTLATSYPPSTPDDSRIDPDESLLSLLDKIRACHPMEFPAFFDLDDRRVVVTVEFRRLPS